MIEGCKRRQRNAQRALYDRYAPRMFGVCRRYVKDYETAEDLLVSGMYKAMDRIGSYQGAGSFEGWLRRVMVNECLMHLRKRKPYELSLDDEDTYYQPEDAPTVMQQLLVEDLKALIDEMPIGYRTVFNLYVMEGYKHREIADLLGISINTSKSQLILARKKMQELVAQRLA